jgi:hypothetical protein
MTGSIFDPRRLRKSPKQLEREGYAIVARMLRDHLGGDPLAEVRRRARHDPALRAMLRHAAAELALAALATRTRTSRAGRPRSVGSTVGASVHDGA